MSLVSILLRVSTVRSLRGATFAGDRVHDSMIDPASLLDQEAEPFIVVAVDSSDMQPTGRDLLGASGQTQLTLDMAVASRVRVPREKGGEDDEPDHIAIPHTDAGMEITLDLMLRQIHRSLLADPGPWPALWRTLVTNVEKLSVDRGASSKDGVRFATRQVIFTLGTIAEPSFGPMTTAWADAIRLMRDDPALGGIAELMEREIEIPSLDGWARAVADLGLRDRYSLGGEALLEAPPEPVREIIAEGDGRVMGVDEQTIEDALGPDQAEKP